MHESFGLSGKPRLPTPSFITPCGEAEALKHTTWARKPIIHYPASFPQRLNTVDLISNDISQSVEVVITSFQVARPRPQQSKLPPSWSMK